MRHGIGGGIVLSLFLLVGHGFCEERPGSGTLELRLEIEKATVVLGEPVYAASRLRNTGTVPVDAAKVLDPQTGDVRIEVFNSARPRFVFLPLFHADAAHARMSLAPGEVVAAAFPIFYGSLGWTFDRAGTYRVTAVYRRSGGTQEGAVRSNTVNVTVEDEGGIGTPLLEKTPAGEEAGKFLLWQRGDHLQAGQALLTKFQQQYSSSPVVDYVVLALGRNMSRHFRNYALGRIRQRDCAAALQYFHQVRSERLPALLQVQQRLDEARCLIAMSQPDRAQETWREAETLSGGRPEFQLLFQQAARLEPALRQTP